MISRVGAVVVLSGNKADSNNVPVPSPGVDVEVQIALSIGKPIIPVGISGHIARKIWEAATADPHRYLPGIYCEAELAMLGKPDASIQEVADAIGTLLERAERLASTKN